MGPHPHRLWHPPPVGTVIRTRASVCARKTKFPTQADALSAAARTDWLLRAYRCDRCGQFHLTSRTKGKRRPRPEV